ncbi:MAG: hypothetical protein Q7T54_05790 [Candidatus Levybacteria bacterium]|nr:hypothetical protein [Candidatus Levybacteria bacterium]
MAQEITVVRIQNLGQDARLICHDGNHFVSMVDTSKWEREGNFYPVGVCDKISCEKARIYPLTDNTREVPLKLLLHVGIRVEIPPSTILVVLDDEEYATLYYRGSGSWTVTRETFERATQLVLGQRMNIVQKLGTALPGAQPTIQRYRLTNRNGFRPDLDDWDEMASKEAELATQYGTSVEIVQHAYDNSAYQKFEPGNTTRWKNAEAILKWAATAREILVSNPDISGDDLNSLKNFRRVSDNTCQTENLKAKLGLPNFPSVHMFVPNNCMEALRDILAQG